MTGAPVSWRSRNSTSSLPDRAGIATAEGAQFGPAYCLTPTGRGLERSDVRRTCLRPEGPLSSGPRGGKDILLVLLRPLRQAALLRWLPQDHKSSAAPLRC